MPQRVTLSAKEYHAIRTRFGYSNYAWRHIIGVSMRQAQRYESGETKIPETCARLMLMFDAHGIPGAWRAD